jgi:hypothetical protein
VASNVSKMCTKFSCKKTCEVLYKSFLHFLHFWFFIKIFMHNYIHMWKITTIMKIIIIWIIQYLSLQFISFRFYIWKIAKIKSLSPVLKKGVLIVNMPPSWIHLFIKYAICTYYSQVNKNDHGWDSLSPCEFNFTFNSPHVRFI